jgi:hypothetical protein
MATDNTSSRLKTTKAFINAFTTLTVADSLRVRAPNCVHEFAPLSVAASIPPKTNSDFAVHLTRFQGLITSFTFAVKETIDNPTANQVLLWTTASPNWAPGVMTGKDGKGKDLAWEYTGEYMFLLSFEDGETGDDGNGGKLKRIERIVEFVDSKGTMRLLDLMHTARGNLETLTMEKRGDGH